MSLTYPENQHHVSNTPWTAERDEALKQLWADGYSASLIADKIAGGDKITRCAVIGRVHRLKLPGRKHSPPAQRKPYPRAKGARKPPRPPPPPARPQRLPPPSSPNPPMRPDMRKLPLLQLEPHHCRWPLGELHEVAHLFCAADTREGEVYCPHHTWMARIHSASACCDSTGQMSLFTETSESLPRLALWPTPCLSDATGGPRTPDAKRGPAPGLKRAVSMSSAAASPARTSPSPERARALAASAAAYGRSTPELLARFDPATSSWKTSQFCLGGELSVFAETWPRSFMIVRGTLFQLPPLVRLTDGIDCGSWPTPRAGETSDQASRPGHSFSLSAAMRQGWQPQMWPTPSASLGDHAGLVTPTKAREGGTLVEAISARTMWPTPTAGDSNGSGSRNTATSKAHPGISLTDAIRQDGGTGRMWPTPTTITDSGGAALCKWGGARSRAKLRTMVSSEEFNGALNPTWVEWLQGFPMGWTEV